MLRLPWVSHFKGVMHFVETFNEQSLIPMTGTTGTEEMSAEQRHATAMVAAYANFALSVPAPTFVQKLTSTSDTMHFAKGIAAGLHSSLRHERALYGRAIMTTEAKDPVLAQVFRAAAIVGVAKATSQGLSWVYPLPESAAASAIANDKFLLMVSRFFVEESHPYKKRHNRDLAMACGLRMADWLTWSTHQGMQDL